MKDCYTAEFHPSVAPSHDTRDLTFSAICSLFLMFGSMIFGFCPAKEEKRLPLKQL